MSDAAIKKLAATFGPNIKGIPWAKLQQETGMPADAIVTTLADKQIYQREMEEAQGFAEHVIEDIDLPWDLTTSESLSAWKEVKNETGVVGRKALEALNTAGVDGVLSDEDAFHMTVSQLKAIVASTYMTAMYGLVLHKKLIMQKMGASPAEIGEHAEQVTKAFNTLVYLSQKGGLNPIKKGPIGWLEKYRQLLEPSTSTQGLGAIQVAVPVVVGRVIVAVAIVGAIAWVMVANTQISTINKAMDKFCVPDGSPEQIHACLELAKMNKVALDSGPPLGLDTIAKYALLGGGLYLLVLFGPALSRAYSAKQRRSERVEAFGT